MSENDRFIHPIRLYTSEAKSAEEFLLEGKADKQTFELGETMSGIIDNPFRAGAPLVQFIANVAETSARDELFDEVTVKVSNAFEEFSWLIGQDDGTYAFSDRRKVQIPDPNIGGIQKKGETEILVALLLLEEQEGNLDLQG